MHSLFLALAGLALAAPAPQAPRAAQPQSHARASHARAPAKPAAPRLQPSADVARVAGWVAAAHDNRALPYAIIDKQHAALFLFDGKGKPITAVPVLIGKQRGDDATPGVGAKSLAEIGPAEKTTPAGRFLAKFGRAAGNARVLWVDYYTSVALHPIPPHYPKQERRRERMLSPTYADNRITFGCINVPSAFYAKKLSPLFRRKGGYVYILPDTKALETVFPQILATPAPPTEADPAPHDGTTR